MRRDDLTVTFTGESEPVWTAVRATLPSHPIVEKLAAWVPMSKEAFEEGPLVRAEIEWLMAAPRSLTLRERVTGWQSFTSSEGYPLTWRVGWRAALYWLTHPVEWWKRTHYVPEPDPDDY